MQLDIRKELAQNPFILAPMEAVNCTSFRLLCQRRGAPFVYSDVIDADVFCEYAQTHTKAEAVAKYINPHVEERLVVQLGGRNIENLKIVMDACPFAQWFDLNVGCPLGYMLGKKGGCYLMKHPDQLYTLVTELVTHAKKLGKGFSVKIRSGWDDKSINAVEIAKGLQDIGICLLTIHPRTRKDLYSKKADWALARKVADALTIPVCLSGDVTNAHSAHAAFNQTKCDAIMCGRGAKHNPSIFTELTTYYKTKQLPTKPSMLYCKTAQNAITDFFEWFALYSQIEQRFSVSEILDHARWTIRGAKNASILQEKLIAQFPKEEQAQYETNREVLHTKLQLILSELQF